MANALESHPSRASSKTHPSPRRLPCPTSITLSSVTQIASTSLVSKESSQSRSYGRWLVSSTHWGLRRSCAPCFQPVEGSMASGDSSVIVHCGTTTTTGGKRRTRCHRSVLYLGWCRVQGARFLLCALIMPGIPCVAYRSH